MLGIFASAASAVTKLLVIGDMGTMAGMKLWLNRCRNAPWAARPRANEDCRPLRPPVYEQQIGFLYTFPLW